LDAPQEAFYPEHEAETLVFEPYHSEAEPVVCCFRCHGMIVGRPGQRLCRCNQPEPLPPALAEKARVLAEARDAAAVVYRRRVFPVMLAVLGDADEAEGRELWRALWPVARDHVERRMQERGLLREFR